VFEELRVKTIVDLLKSVLSVSNVGIKVRWTQEEENFGIISKEVMHRHLKINNSNVQITLTL